MFVFLTNIVDKWELQYSINKLVVSIFNLLPIFLLEIDKDFENMLRDVIDSIKATNPMIRLHLQYQNIVIVVRKPSHHQYHHR